MYKVCSLFAGIGGIDKGFEQAGFEIIYANEFDKNACKTYKANNSPYILDESDITKKDISTIPAFDVLVGGFPCQPFSLAGNKQGMNDVRGTLFFNIVEILKYHKPLAFMLENVENLQNIRKGQDFKVIIEQLTNIGYTVHYQVMGSNTHANIPQCRKRIFIIGFKSNPMFTFPTIIPLTKTLNDIIDRKIKVENKYYYTKDSQYYSMLINGIKNDSIYQLRRVYVRENKNNVCPTLTANMGVGGHNVPLIKDNFGIRKLTPQECAKFQGFDKLNIVVANTSIYKQIGNSVTIPLIKRIAEQIKQSLDSGL